MFGSSILEAAIGIILVYLLLSLISSALQESIEGVLKVRALNLEKGLRAMLQDPDGEGLTKYLYEHPLIFSLFRGDYLGGKIRKGLSTNLPTYIPAANFAAALMDIIVRGPVNGEGKGAASPTEVTFETLRAAVESGNQLGGSIQRALLMALDSAQGDLAKAQANIEAWFNSTMDRVSGWYKRYTHLVLLVIGLILAVGMNVDSVRVGSELYKNDALRATTVAQAAVVTKSETSPEASLETARTMLEGLKLPIGWSGELDPRLPWYSQIGDALQQHLIGWLVTAFAVSFGAPFWFDLLNKLMVIRSTVKPHEKSPEESSEDRQVSGK